MLFHGFSKLPTISTRAKTCHYFVTTAPAAAAAVGPPCEEDAYGEDDVSNDDSLQSIHTQVCGWKSSCTCSINCSKC